MNPLWNFIPCIKNFQNYNEEWRKKRIRSGNTVLAFIPVSFQVVMSDENILTAWRHITDKKRKKKGTWVYFMLITEVLKLFLNHYMIFLNVIVIRTTEGKKRHFHLLLSSYLADVPKAEDLISVKRNTSNKSMWNRCILRKDQLPFWIIAGREHNRKQYNYCVQLEVMKTDTMNLKRLNNYQCLQSRLLFQIFLCLD